MTAHEINHLAGYIALAAVVPALATTLVYGIGSPWWRSWLGRVVFAQWLAIVVVFGVVLLRRFLGAYPGHEWVAVISYSILFLAFTAMAVIVTIERRAPARARQLERIANMSNTPGDHVAKTEAEATVSPKVIATAVTSTVLTVIVAVAAAVTPDMLANLGGWGVLIYAGIVSLGGALAGYIKRDPLRE